MCAGAQLEPQHEGVGHSHPSVSGPTFLLQSDHPALHAYEQRRVLLLVLVPQKAFVALFSWQVMPHPPQLAGVSSSSHVAPHSVSPTGQADVQTPLSQIRLPPHGVPSGTSGFVHTPVAGLQEPGTWHESTGAHTTGLTPVQVPFWHTSVMVHAFPSSQNVPFGAGATVQRPEGARQKLVWHGLMFGQKTGFDPTHTPA
jgi:hypothetical protein